MKLSKIYSNLPLLFEPICFNEGLNVVLGQIRDPNNRGKDTHNLGKTTLLRLIDFCLLKKTNKRHFLFKHKDKFKDFVFFLEIKTVNGDFLTIRRSVANATKISIKKHATGLLNLVDADESSWDHREVPYERAKQLVDGILDLRSITPWPFRTALGYALRAQEDYNDVFKLSKFIGKHSDWKPFLGHIFGFNAADLTRNYDLTEQLEEASRQEENIKKDLVGVENEPDKISGVLLIKETELNKLERNIEEYNFQLADSKINGDLVSGVEVQISGLNERRYYLSLNLRRIEDSLNENIAFSLGRAQKIFEDARVYFGEQLKKDYSALLRFNETITIEREAYLKIEAEELRTEIADIATRLSLLNRERASALAILKDRETFAKYRKLTALLADMKADVEVLARQKRAIADLQALQKRIRDLKREQGDLQSRIREEIESQSAGENNRYRAIRLLFHEVVNEVMDRNGVLSTRVNDAGNLEFSAEILDAKGEETSENEGHTYLKLLCIAFDLAVIRAYLSDKFIRFAYHDGALETLDFRKKLNLIELMRSYGGQGIQQIITVIDSDLPMTPEGQRFEFSEFEVVTVLHDEGDSGRLFKMPVW
jgi:uncharacterized protein YydD (DUF2326 family)